MSDPASEDRGEDMSDPRELAAVVREALTKGYYAGLHHPNCSTGQDEGCDCYAQSTYPARAALDALVAECERLMQLLEDNRRLALGAALDESERRARRYEEALREIRDSGETAPALRRIARAALTEEEA